MVMTTKMATGEDLPGTLPTTVLEVGPIGLRTPTSMTVEQGQEEGV